MSETKVETQRRLSPESVQLINEIWDLLVNITGAKPTPEQMRKYTGGKDEYELRKLAYQLREKYRATPTNKSVIEGGEGSAESN